MFAPGLQAERRNPEFSRGYFQNFGGLGYRDIQSKVLEIRRGRISENHPDKFGTMLVNHCTISCIVLVYITFCNATSTDLNNIRTVDAQGGNDGRTAQTDNAPHDAGSGRTHASRIACGAWDWWNGRRGLTWHFGAGFGLKPPSSSQIRPRRGRARLCRRGAQHPL